MSFTFYSVFNLPQDYTIDQLNNAYQEKVDKAHKSSLTELDQNIYKESLKSYYNQAKKVLQRRDFISELSNFSDFTPLSFLSPLSYSFPSNSHDVFPILNNPFHLQSQLSHPTQQPTFPNNHNEVFSSSSTYREQLMPDGSKLVVKESSSNNNGNITKNTKSYRQLSNGTTEPIEYDVAMQQLQNRKYLK